MILMPQLDNRLIKPKLKKPFTPSHLRQDRFFSI